MENSLLLIEEIVIVLIVLFGLWLGFWVWDTNRKERLNQWFAVMAISVALWVVFALLGFLAKDAFRSLFFYRLNWGVVALFLVSAFYFYIIHFLSYKEKEKYKILGKFILSLGTILIALSVFTDTIIRKTIIKPWGAEIIFGPVNALFNLYAFLIAFLVIGLLIKRYFQLSQPEKLKTQYFLIGTALFAVFNVVFNIISPIVTKTVAYQHFGDYSAIFLLGFTGYAIVKRELFGIKVVLTALLVGLIAVLLLLDALIFTQDLFFQLLKGLILVLFICFGYYLVRSVQLEIKRREEMEKLTYQLETVNIKLAAAYQELEILDKAKSEFISIASHQLRTPLAAIKGYISMLLEGAYGKLNERARRPMENIYQSNERLIKLVNDLLNLSRLEAGKIKFEPEPASLEEMIKDIIEELRMAVENKGLYIKMKKPAPPLPKIIIDREHIRQAVLNIIDNAIKYTKKGGVTIELSKIDDTEQIKISDTGEGMEKEELEGLFQMFSRATAGTQFHTEGAGIGLYIAKQFVKMHKGRIYAESKGKSKGSTFYIELPLKESLRLSTGQAIK